MAAEEYLSSELQRLLEGFTKIQDVHLALQTYCELQDERMSMEQERSEKLKVNLEKIYEAYLLLQTRYKSSIEEFDKERNELRGTIEELREQCEHLRSINILEDHNGVSRLQDEVEVLKIRLEMQDHQHREDIALLKQQHSDEIKRYKMLLNATESEPKKKSRAKNPGKVKRGVPSLFRWPELKMNVEAVRKNIEENQQETKKAVKKRKLFSEDEGIAIDVVQDES